MITEGLLIGIGAVGALLGRKIIAAAKEYLQKRKDMQEMTMKNIAEETLLALASNGYVYSRSTLPDEFRQYIKSADWNALATVDKRIAAKTRRAEGKYM